MKMRTTMIFFALVSVLTVNLTFAQEKWTDWAAFGTYTRVKEIGRVQHDGRTLVEFELQIKQNVKVLDAENTNFGDYRIVISPTVAGPGQDIHNMPVIAVEFSRTTEQIYTVPFKVYCFVSQDDDYMTGEWDSTSGLVKYRPKHSPETVMNGAIYLNKDCDDQAFKGSWMSCRGNTFVKP